MAHEALGGLGMDTGRRQKTAGRVPQCVEVHYSVRLVAVCQEAGPPPLFTLVGGHGFVDPRPPRCLKVGPEHEHKAIRSRHRERQRARELARKMLLESIGQTRPKRQRVVAPPLGVSGFHHYRRLRAIQVETSAGQASQFIRTQSGLNRKLVQ